MTDLHHASEQGNIDEVTKLLATVDVNSVDLLGQTPLHKAAWAGHKEVAELLLKKGALLHAKNIKGQTPLHYALENRRNDVTMFLLESGVDIHLTDDHGNTALLAACEASFDYFIVEAILKLGAEIEARNDEDWTPLLRACSTASQVGVADILDTLVEYGADVNPKITLDGNGRTKNWALYTACGFYESLDYCVPGGNDAILALLDYGCGNVPSEDGDTTDLIFTLHHFEHTPAVVECFERHFIKLEVARLRLPSELSPDVPEPLKLEGDWTDDERTAFRNDCKREIETMKFEKVKSTNVSYSSVFYLSPFAYRSLVDSNVALTWEDEDPWKCMSLFPVYGRLLYYRSKLGFRRLPLLDKCYGFFPLLTELPELPIECMDEILSYLDETDLSKLGEICR